MESLRQKRQAKERRKKEAHLRPKKRCGKDKASYRVILIDQSKGSETEVKYFKAKSNTRILSALALISILFIKSEEGNI